MFATYVIALAPSSTMNLLYGYDLLVHLLGTRFPFCTLTLYLMIDDAAAEKRPFLESGPESVKLTPSWEDRNLPAAELNLRGLESDLDKAALDMDPPPDR